jgi:7-alpha-hydroxysteroid dehydrogenase
MYNYGLSMGKTRGILPFVSLEHQYQTEIDSPRFDGLSQRLIQLRRGVEAMLSMFSLEGRVAVVTGGGRGIGKAIALGFAEAGTEVVVAARTATEIEKSAEEIRAIGRKAVPIVADVMASDQVTSMVNRSLEEFGRIDILVNNAGGGPKRPALQQSERYWDAIMRLNLTSALLCSKAVAEPMIR